MKIIEAGERDYFLQNGEYKNPYSPRSNQFDDYERGWMQSLKFDNGKLVKLLCEEVKVAPEKINQYALMKGREKPRT